MGPAHSLGLEIDHRPAPSPERPSGDFYSIHVARSEKNQVALYQVCKHQYFRNRLMTLPVSDIEMIHTIQELAQYEIVRIGVVGSSLLRFTPSLDFLNSNPGVQRESMWTLDHAFTSQFENEIRAVTNLPLGDIASIGEWMTIEFSAPGHLDMVHPYLHLFARNPRYKIHKFTSHTGVISIRASDEAKWDLREELVHAVDYLEGVIDE